MSRRTTEQPVTPPPFISDDRVLDKKSVAARINLSVATLDRMVRSRRFPAATRLSPRRIGWRLSSVEAWLSANTGDALIGERVRRT